MCEPCCGCKPPKLRPSPTNPIDSTAEIQAFLNAAHDTERIRIQPQRRVIFGTLYAMYEEAVDHPVGPNKFGTILTSLGFPSLKGTNGIRLRAGIGIPGIAP